MEGSGKEKCQHTLEAGESKETDGPLEPAEEMPPFQALRVARKTYSIFLVPNAKVVNLRCSVPKCVVLAEQQ